MNAREIIENQQQLIDLLREKVERLEAEKTEAYELAGYIACAMMVDNFQHSPTVGAGRWNAELMFQKALEQTDKRTSYKFITREVDPKYLKDGEHK